LEIENYQSKPIPLDFETLKPESKASNYIHPYNDTNDKSNSIRGYSIPFYAQVPKVVNKSYVGKYSEYFWAFEVKFDIPFTKDVHAKAILDIV